MKKTSHLIAVLLVSTITSCSDEENLFADAPLSTTSATVKLALPLGVGNNAEQLIVSGLWSEKDTLLRTPTSTDANGEMTCYMQVPLVKLEAAKNLQIGVVLDNGNAISFIKPIASGTSYKASTVYAITMTESEKKELYSKAEGHSYVDLGLSFDIAAYNVDVDEKSLNSAEDYYGNYYKWGSVTPTPDGTEYQGAEDFSGNAQYDVATNKWGGKWAMHTFAQYEELMNATSIRDTLGLGHTIQVTWTKSYKGIEGLAGAILQNIYTGASVFYPACGTMHPIDLQFFGEYALSWITTPYTEAEMIEEFGNPNAGPYAKTLARHLVFKEDMKINHIYGERTNSTNIRPILNK